MKLLIFACALLSAEAAKLQGYEPQRPGSTDVTLSTFSGSSSQVPHAHISNGPQEGQFLSSSNGILVAQPQQSSHGSNQHTLQQSLTTQVGTGQPTLDTQFHGTASLVQQVQQNSLGVDTNNAEVRCPDGHVRHFDGSCITPEIIRNVFVYAVPKQEPKPTSLPPSIPLPKVEHNIVFIRTQNQGAGPDPIIVPPPQKKHVIYVLNKESEDQEQRVIEVPAPEQRTPEVFFVNYADGETPTLPDGIDFETALNSAIHAEGQIIGGSNVLTQSAGENTDINNLGITSGLGNEIVGNDNSGLILVSESETSEENIVLNNGGIGNIAVTSGGPQTTVSNRQISGFSGDVILDSSANRFETSPVAVNPGPQQLYTTP